MRQILFLCVENSCRSQIAEAFVNIHSQGDVSAHSSGSNPSGNLNPKAVIAMNEVGYNLNSHGSKSLDDIPDIEYDVVVFMGCGDECPTVRAKERVEWDIPDPKSMDEEQFREVRDEIKRKVVELLKEGS